MIACGVRGVHYKQVQSTCSDPPWFLPRRAGRARTAEMTTMLLKSRTWTVHDQLDDHDVSPEMVASRQSSPANMASRAASLAVSRLCSAAGYASAAGSVAVLNTKMYDQYDLRHYAPGVTPCD